MKNLAIIALIFFGSFLFAQDSCKTDFFNISILASVNGHNGLNNLYNSERSHINKGFYQLNTNSNQNFNFGLSVGVSMGIGRGKTKPTFGLCYNLLQSKFHSEYYFYHYQWNSIRKVTDINRTYHTLSLDGGLSYLFSSKWDASIISSLNYFLIGRERATGYLQYNNGVIIESTAIDENKSLKNDTNFISLEVKLNRKIQISGRDFFLFTRIRSDIDKLFYRRTIFMSRSISLGIRINLNKSQNRKK